MSDTVIQIENLGKKYIIGHQQEGNSRVALRDVIADGARSLGHRLRHPGKPIDRPYQEEFWALKDVSFEVKQGEVVGIIGRNGAGKSTLLKILSRITEPTTGRINIKGRVASLLEVGTGFHPELTGRENIFLNGVILGMSKVEISRKFDEIVYFAEVEKFLDTPVKRYSSGMYVRLAFAVAAYMEPDILFIDEVLAVGDTQFQKKCLGKIDDVAKEGRTILFVSHGMPSIYAFCQRVIWLQKGSLKLSGDPSQVIPHYLSEGLNIDEAQVDLRQHPGRSHSQENALRKAWILNSKSIKTNSISMGEHIKIYIDFSFTRIIKNPGFGLGVDDEYGKRIFSLNNYMKPTSKPIDSIVSGVVCFELDCLPLMPGKYYVSVSLTEDQNTFIDFVEQAIQIQVQAYDVFKSGKIPERSQGIIFVNGDIVVYPG